MREYPEMMIEVHGHTDDLGSVEFNQELSLQRAQNVVAFLTNQGIDEKRMVYKGFDSTQPVADNVTEAGRSKNRRVEFYIIRK